MIGDKRKGLKELANEGNRLAKLILNSGRCEHNWIFQKTENNKDIYYCSKCLEKITK